MRRSTKGPALLDGNKWRNTHQATIDSVLSKISEHRSVSSRGHSFYNRDSWTARAFGAALCEWARLNPASVPDRYDVEAWVLRANQSSIADYQKGIVIASTPDDLPRWLAFALVGGGYHEGWHTLYSRRTRIHINEVWPKVRDLWGLIPYDPAAGKKGWAGLTKSLLDWGNIIEDIRIERVGCREFPGAPAKMEALQDLILSQEAEGREKAEARGAVLNDDLSVVTGTFRDVGLGYDTPSQNAALRKYKTRSEDGYKFATEGPLKPMLDRSIALGAKDDMEHLWLAMEVLAAIVEASEPPPPPEPEEEPEDGGEGESGDEGKPEPKPQEAPDQLEASDFDNDEEDSEGEAQPAPPTSKPLLYKKGDRALLKSGPHAGCLVEVTKASLPHPESGVQKLEFALVEDEA
jgi:hypothetical protein